MESNWLGKLWVNAKDLLENGKHPLLPAPTFYSNWHGTVKDLAMMASKILKYLKFRSPWVLRVDFTYDIDSPGLFTAKDGNAKYLFMENIKITPQHVRQSSRMSYPT